jgi:hypothetical protein
MKIIGFTGYKQSGKDTTAGELRKLLLPKSVVQVNFADALKQEVARACGVAVDCINANKAAYRPLLQVWGTEYRRKMFGENYWLLKWLKASLALTTKANYLFCTDVRFLNEADTVRQCGGTILRITRPGVVADAHTSETEQDKIVADFTIHNDTNVDGLRQQLNKLKL